MNSLLRLWMMACAAITAVITGLTSFVASLFTRFRAVQGAANTSNPDAPGAQTPAAAAIYPHFNTVFMKASLLLKRSLLVFIFSIFSFVVQATNYYLTVAGQGNAQNLASWRSNADGSGTNPSSFTANGDKFIIPSSITAAIWAGNTIFGSSSASGTGVTLQVDGTLTINNGITITLNGKNANNSSVIVNGTIVFIGTAKVSLNDNDTRNSFTLASGATLKTSNLSGIVGTGCSIEKAVGPTSTVALDPAANYEFNGNPQNATGLPTSITGNVTIASGASVGLTNPLTIGTSGVLTVNGTLTPGPTHTISGMGSLTGTGTAKVTVVNGGLNDQYTIATKSLNNLTVEYNTTAAQTISPANYNNLIVAGPRGANNITFANTGTIGVSGSLTITATGNYITSGSTIDYNGTGSQTIITASPTTFIYNNLTISGVRSGNVTLESGLINVTGNYNASTTFTSGGFITTGNTVKLAGGAQSISGSNPVPFANLTTLLSGQKTLNQDVLVNGTLDLQAGNLDLNGKTLTIGGNSITVTGAKSITSTGNAVVEFINSGTCTISGTSTPSLTFGPSVTVRTAKSVNFGANLSTINGTFEINQYGSVATNPPLYGTNSTLIYKNATYSFSSGPEWSAASGAGFPYHVIVDNTGVNLGSTNHAIAGDLTLINNGSITLGFSNKLIVPGNVSLDNNSALTLGYGSGSDLYVGGNWTENNSNFSAGFRNQDGNGVLRFFGSNNAQFTDPAFNGYNRISFEKTGGATVTLNNSIQVNRELALNSVVNTGNNTLTMQQEATLTRTTGHVNGNLQLVFSSGHLTRTYPIGDGVSYAPVDITMTGLTTPAGVVAATSAGDHSSLSSSLIVPTQSVNRAWSVTNNGVAFSDYAITFNYPSIDVDAGATPASFIIGKYDGSNWTYPTISGTPTSTSITGSGLTSFSSFAVGAASGSLPTIASQPADQTVCAPAVATFSASANSNPPSTVQWQISTDGGETYTNLTIASPYSVSTNSSGGVTTSTLTIDPTASALDGYKYKAVFTNIKGSVTSDAATFVVNTKPTITCPGNITVNTDAGVCSSLQNFSASVTGSPAPTVTYKIGSTPITSPYTFPVGETIVNVTASNICGTTTCSFTVTVNDTEDPTIVALPANITKSNDAGVCGATVTWTAPTAADNCTGSSIAQTAGPLPGSVFPIGTTTVTYTATDAANNTHSESFTVTVNDTEDPTIVALPANITKSNDAGVCGATVTWTAPTAADNCTGSSIAQTAGPLPGSVFPIGTTTVTYTATDAANNTHSESFTVTVNDTEDPTIVALPANITKSNDAGVCGATVTWTAPTAADNCTGSSIAQTAGPLPGSVFPIGTTTVTYTATDAANNTHSESFTVTVNDTEDPTIVALPANITKSNDAGVCGATVTWTAPTAADNCTGSSIAQTAGPLPGSVFPIGTTTVTYTATDAANNTHSESFTVTVNDTEDPTIVALPANITKSNDAGVCGATVTWTAPTAADNCTGSSIAQTAGPLPGSVFPIGTTTVTYTATDAANNTHSESFTVTVNDTEDPTIVALPANITKSNDAGVCGATVTWTAPTAADNCTGSSIAQTAGPLPGSVFPIGTTTVTYTATDAANNTHSESFTVTVNDTEDPTIVALPANITKSNDAGVCGATVTWTAPTAADNCTGSSIAQTAGPLPGSVFPIGTTTVTYTATDAANNTHSESFTVTVNDTEDPTIVALPANITKSNDAGVCGATVTWTAPTAADNCTGSSIAQTAGPLPGSVFPIGTTTVTYTATDAANNTHSESFTVTVNDTEDPTIVALPANITKSNDAGVCGATVTWTAPTAADNCTGSSIAQTAGPLPGSVFPIGTTTVTYTATDAANNTHSESFTVTVNDTEDPTIVALPANITKSNDAGVCGATVTWTAPTAADNCTGSSIAQTAGPLPGSVFPIGTTTVTYTATDAANNTHSESFTVTVNDTEDPTIVALPANITKSNDAGVCGATVTWTAPTAADNCTGSSIAQTAGPLPGSVFPIGTTTVTYTATDAANNTHSESFTVTVNDTEDPTIVALPANITKSNDAGVCGATVTWTAPTAADNCTGSSIAQTAGPLPGSVFPIGTTTVTYTATDAANNTHSESFTVTVNDTEDPTIVALPANITKSNDAGVCGATVTWTAPTAADNCTGSSIAQTAGPLPGSVFPIGTTTVTYTATDAANNTHSESFTVTVNDTEDPTIVALPANITKSNDAGVCGATVTWTAPTAADNCTGSSIAQTAGPLPGSVFPIGTTTVTYTATDAANNTHSESFTVTVNDTEDPTIVALPANITKSNDAGVCGATVTWTAPTAADNCTGSSIAQTAGPLPGSVFPIGTTTVTYTATDAANNTHSESFTVTVNDTEDPTIVALPANITKSNDAGVCGATVTWTAPTAADNCTGSSIAQTAGPLPGSVFPIGTTTVTYTATDAANNTHSESFTVTVNDTEDPTIVALPANITKSNDAGVCGATVTWTAPTAADNCTGSSIAQTAGPLPGSVFPIGTTTVTYTATDAANNTHSESFTVTVNDTEDPTIVALPANITKSNDAGVCGATVTWTAPTAADNCTGSSIAQTAGPLPGSVFPIGTTTVTYTATDAANNTHSESFTVTVNDTEDPTIVALPANITKSNDAGVCGATVTWTAPTAADNCTGSSIAQTAGPLPGSVFPIGTTTVTYTATDAANNTHSESFTVTVNDTEDPTIVALPANITKSNDAGVCGATVTWTAPTAADNCTGSSIAQTAGPLPGSVFPIGTTTVTYTATDAANNTHSESFTVTVNDTEDPTIVALPANITKSNDAGVCGATVTWTAPTAADNCTGSSIAQTAGPLPGSVFPIGTTTVTYTATDAANNTHSESFTVTVNDTEDPTIVALPANITKSNDAGVCGATVTWTAPTAADNCTGSSIAQTAGPLPGSVFPIGTTTVTYTATDAANNTHSESFTVTVNDTEDPTIVALPANITKSNDAGVCGATVTWTAPTAADNCTGSSIAQTAGPLPGSVFPIGTTTVTYTATDAANNTHSESFTVTVNDTEDPTIVALPANITKSNDAGVCGATVTWTAPTAADNCTGSSIAQTAGPLPGSVFPIGTTTVTYTATDAANNTHSESFTVTVNDTEDPTIVALPANITKSNDAGVCGATVTWTAPTAADNCTGSSIAQTAGPLPGSVFPIGTTTVTYTATDAANNTHSESFTVTVNDTEDPTMSTVQNRNESVGSSCNFTIPDYRSLSNITDNCGIATITQSPLVGTVISGHNTTQLITITATDVHGNSNLTSFTITLKDVTLPTITCNGGNIIHNTDAGQCSAVITAPDPSSTDNCGVTVRTWSLTGANSASSPATGLNSLVNYTFNKGVTTITWTVKDIAGNTATCSQTVTVEDHEDPVITCASGSPFTRNTNTGVCSYTVSGTEFNPTSFGDNCPGSTIKNSFNSSNTLAGAILPKGTTNIVWTVTDAAGNTSSCSISVTVEDHEAPVITCPNAAPFTKNTNNNICYYTSVGTEFNATATDNCGITSLTYSLSGVTTGTGTSLTGVVFNKGVTTVTWTAKDEANNTVTCSFTVTVQDKQAPSLTCKPNKTFFVDKGAPKYTVQGSELDATATDNCGSYTLTYTLSGATTGSGSTLNGVQLNKGTTTIAWTAIDPSGNKSQCSTTVIVTKRQTQLIVNSANPVQYSDKASLSAQLKYNAANYGDPADWQPLEGKDVSLGINSQATTAVGTSNNTGLAAASLQILQAPSTYNTTASFAGDDYYEPVNNFTINGLTVAKENARIEYTGDVIKATATASTPTATVTLRANILDITAVDQFDTDAGDIRNAKVKFVNLDASSDITDWIPVTTLVNSADTKVGTVSTTYTMAVDASGSKSTNIGILVDNGYYISSEDLIVTIYQPNGDFITGGGHIINTNSVGSMKGDLNSKTNFGFNVKFNKKGTQLQGNLNFIFRRTEPTDNKVHVYQVKSNSMLSLGVNATNAQSQTANYLAKCNMIDITNPSNPISINPGGGVKFMYVNMVDNGEPGTNDVISFVLVSGNGNNPDDPTVLSNIIYSSNWVTTKTEMKNLAGGNLVVHSGFNLGASTAPAPATRTVMPQEQEITGLFDLKAYPNPTTSKFAVQITSSDKTEKVQVRVLDITGRTIEVVNNLQANQTIQMGERYRPGVYFIEMTQGSQRKVLKVMKQAD